MRWNKLTLVAFLPLLVASLGCDDEESSTDGAGGDCWWCGGKGGTTGKGGSDKGGYVFTVSGTLDRSTGEGTYRIEEADDTGTVCDVTYAVTGATEDTSCTSCTFAFTMPLSMPAVAVADGCSGSEALDGDDVGYGHGDPNTVFSGKDGAWDSIGAGSTVDGDDWSFSVAIDLSAGK